MIVMPLVTFKYFLPCGIFCQCLQFCSHILIVRFIAEVEPDELESYIEQDVAHRTEDEDILRGGVELIRIEVDFI